MLSSHGDDVEYKIQVYRFAEYISKNMEKIFFLSPSDILNHGSRMK